MPEPIFREKISWAKGRELRTHSTHICADSAGTIWETIWEKCSSKND